MKDFDVIIVGAGPVGLTFASALAASALRVALVEQLPRATLEDPPFDGREIALTHDSIRTLRDTGVWAHVPEAEVSPLRSAHVWNGSVPRPLRIARTAGAARPLGYLVSNHLLRRAAWQRAHALAGVTLFCESRVTDLASASDDARTLTLQDGTRLCAPLVVSADSRFSTTRRAAGISATSKDFGRTMLVCRMRHTVDHGGIAWEWFDYGQTLALLPLNGGHTSSVVVTVDDHEARRLMGLSEAAFAADLERRFRGRLGTLQTCSTRHAYPLVGVVADRFVARRHALIGDAAVGMHPVTAHGFNLGLLGQATLARELVQAAARGADLGAPALLDRYERAHRRATLPMYLATHALVKLYTADAPPWRLARHAVLGAADRFTPFRQAVAALI